jgi:hypothetical protein
VYSTDSDVIDLRIAGGQEIQLVDGVVDGVIGPVNDVGDLLPEALRIHIATNQSGATTDGGRFVNALRISVGATGIDPADPGDDLLGILDPGQLLGSLGLDASVDAEAEAECSDGVDNDGDGLIDFPTDPGCDSPQDDDERNQCVDGVDNDGDGLVDLPADPGCDSPQDDDERDGAPGGPTARQLPRTGGGAAAPLLGVGLLSLAGVVEALRRRVVPGS